jgi:hypothetical protein
MTENKRTPRIDPSTPIGRLYVCTRAIIESRAGRCAEGVIVRDDNPRVVTAPECFTPLMLQVETSEEAAVSGRVVED